MNYYIISQIVPWGDEEILNVHLKENDADIAISGHTHDARVSKLDKKSFLNPGSITGAYGPYKKYSIQKDIVLK
jgi:vacuolar protein sorting-associated protein 29